MNAHLRKRLFAVQQRLAITTGEALALVTFCGLMALGGVVSHVQQRSAELDTSSYAALDEAVRAAARLPADGTAPGAPADAMEAVASGAGDESPASVEPVSDRPSPLAPIRLDPNTASSRALQRLPGIGPALAGRIIEHRERQGPFRSTRDLLQVRGIGPRTLERLEPYLRIEEPSEPGPPDYQVDGGGGSSSGSSVAPSPDDGLP